MLELNNLLYHPATSDKPILTQINLKVTLGLPVIITGLSGSGKTSLVEIISGLSRPQRGRILWDEKLLNERQRRWLCGVVFQFPERHFLGLTVAQELRLGHRRLSGEAQSKALRKVGLFDVDLRQSPEKLSGGQQRRLAVAVQLLRNPSILLLDEPTAGLDWSVRGEIIQLLSKLSKERIVIVVTHELEAFKQSSNIFYQLNAGKLQQIT